MSNDAGRKNFDLVAKVEEKPFNNVGNILN
jgi:hypothetical protein